MKGDKAMKNKKIKKIKNEVQKRALLAGMGTVIVPIRFGIKTIDLVSDTLLDVAGVTYSVITGKNYL